MYNCAAPVGGKSAPVLIEWQSRVHGDPWFDRLHSDWIVVKLTGSRIAEGMLAVMARGLAKIRSCWRLVQMAAISAHLSEILIPRPRPAEGNRAIPFRLECPWPIQMTPLPSFRTV